MAPTRTDQSENGDLKILRNLKMAISEIPVHPVQTPQGRREQGWAPQAVTMAAYEVYCHVHAPQAAMVTGGCRSGFSTGELIAFLYARGFPKAEWGARVDEAFRGAKNL